MSKEITFILEPERGKLATEVSGISPDLLTDLRDDLGTSQNVNCGKPFLGKAVKLPTSTDSAFDDNHSIWLYRIYHNSVVDGPGVRSVVQVAGCSIGCPGCYVPETHERLNGKCVSIASVVREIVSKRSSHDGVTIIGGEPFDQPKSVAELVARLKYAGFHLTIYSGYTIEQLIKLNDPATNYIITHIDVLIEGPFLLLEKMHAGEYKGSRNQKIIGMS